MKIDSRGTSQEDNKVPDWQLEPYETYETDEEFLASLEDTDDEARLPFILFIKVKVLQWVKMAKLSH